MADPQRIKEYILKNRDRYTRKSITVALLKQGHSREDIDLEWQSLADGPRTIGLPKRHRKRELDEVIMFVLFVGGGIFLCPALSLFGGRSLGVKAVPFIDPIFVAAGIATLIYAGALFRQGTNYLKATAILVVVSFAWFVVIFGICSFPP